MRSFVLIFLYQKITKLTKQNVAREKLLEALLYKKFAGKMLMKLTTGLLGREQPEIAARKSVRYIAAQGPGEETTPLFWEMIWQQVIRGQFK